MIDPARISLAALVPYPIDSSPSQRFRIEQWRPLLERQGISVELRPFADDRLMEILHRPGRPLAKAALATVAVLRRLAELRRTRAADAVFIHRGACLFGPALVERLIGWAGPPLLFDFDDAIYLLHTTAANRALGWLKFPGKTASLCRLSRHVVVANPGLAEYARRYNRQVTIVPSSVDTDKFRPRPKGPAGPRLRVGWTGSSTSATHLELFAPMLRRAAAELPIELHVHSDRRPDLDGVAFEWHPWAAPSEAETLALFDVGIMPMPDDPWSRGKSAMKALLYMAMGVPAVCSAVGTNREVIADGQNGLLAGSEEEWIAALRRLAGDAALRERLGAAGRDTVERSYSARHCATLFGDVVRGLV